MLVRLLIAADDPELTNRLIGLSSEPDLQSESVAPGLSLQENRARTDADFVILDRTALGESEIGELVEKLRDGRSRPEILYLASEESGEERAAALAGGCLAVIDTGAEDSTLEEAVLTLVRSWRERTVQLIEADHAFEQFRLGDFVSHSPAMAKFMRVANRVAKSTSSLLILGETGVGKERLAMAIHLEGSRATGPFVVVNCGAIPESLMESELFGHEKGAFTGAHRAHRGHFEMAHGGTLFLDEVGELPLHLQVKLLRVLQERRVQRIGSEQAIDVDVRVIAATNRDLKSEMDSGGFRPDLYYRLSVVTLTIPPLRERLEDIPHLVEAYLERFRTELRSDATKVTKSALHALQSYSWPGNVREVINVIERATLVAEGEEITLDDLPEEIAAGHLTAETRPAAEQAQVPLAELDEAWFKMPLRKAKRAWSAAFERAYLERVLTQTKGRINETSTIAAIDPRSLYEKMRQHGLRKEDFKS